MNNKYFEKNGGVFNCIIKNSSIDFKLSILNLFIIINKHYHEYRIREISGDTFEQWEDFALKNRLPSYFTVKFKVWYQIGDELKFDTLNDCMVIDIDETEDNLTSITFHFQPVVNNFKYILLDDKGEEIYLEEDQSKSAKLNRKIMADFLKDIEIYLGEIIEYGTVSGAIERTHMYKYGLLESAIQNYV